MKYHRTASWKLVAIVALTAASPRLAVAGGDWETTPAQLPLLLPSVVEYRWTFLVAHWSMEPHTSTGRVYAPRLRATRIDYGVVEIETKRKKVGWIAGFDCKYSDFALPNRCRTTWREVHVDVPVPVVRRDYVDIDVPEWAWRRWQDTVDLPRLVWKEETLVVSLPAVVVTAAPPP